MAHRNGIDRKSGIKCFQIFLEIKQDTIDKTTTILNPDSRELDIIVRVEVARAGVQHPSCENVSSFSPLNLDGTETSRNPRPSHTTDTPILVSTNTVSFVLEMVRSFLLLYGTDTLCPLILTRLLSPRFTFKFPIYANRTHVSVQSLTVQQSPPVLHYNNMIILRLPFLQWLQQ